MLEKRDGQEPAQIAKLSRAAQKSIIMSEKFRAAGSVGAYFALGSEVRTDLIISEANKLGKIVALPRVEGESISFYQHSDSNHLVKGRFGIMEPLPQTEIKVIDLLVVPGIAFDRRGYRLGYGKGYYDKFLLKNPTVSIGLAYSIQLVENLPHGSHDRRMDAIATENGIVTPAE
jgi:5-formyltetrahydrofolate cyclo-ligase